MAAGLGSAPLKLNFLVAEVGIGLRAWEYKTLTAFLGTTGELGKLDFLSCLSLRDSMNIKHRLEPDGLGLTFGSTTY